MKVGTVRLELFQVGLVEMATQPVDVVVLDRLAGTDVAGLVAREIVRAAVVEGVTLLGIFSTMIVAVATSAISEMALEGVTDLKGTLPFRALIATLPGNMGRVSNLFLKACGSLVRLMTGTYVADMSEYMDNCEAEMTGDVGAGAEGYESGMEPAEEDSVRVRGGVAGTRTSFLPAAG